jgi:large subunit ribosomal protein L2
MALVEPDLSKERPLSSKIEFLPKNGGRNNYGRTTSRFRGGGAKRLYRKVDFRRRLDGVPARVEAIEYDPNRTCRLARLLYADGRREYILCPAGLRIGDTVASGEKVEPRVGNAMPLESIPTGFMVHNVELVPGGGGVLGRSAGAQIQVMAKDGAYAHLALPSGEIRRVHVKCRATVGQVGNLDHMNVVLGKAGRTRHLGRRPHNRGVSMNPVAHPLGGGEGRTGGGRHPCSPTGVLAKGFKTRHRRKPSTGFIVKRRR